MQSSPQVPCTLAEMFSLFGMLGMAMEGDRSSNLSSRPDPLEQLSVHLNETENRMHDFLPVVPLLKGFAVQGEGVL